MIRFFAFLSALYLSAAALSAQVATDSGNGAVLRVLDKVSGKSSNYELNTGTALELGKLTVALRACRYPKGGINADAFAFLEVQETETAQQVFRGWMVASSPALNAMEHARYDVWVLRCKTS